MTRSCMLGLLMLLAVSSASVAQPSLVANLSSGPDTFPAPALPSFGVEHRGVLYFPASDPQHGLELWRTDGTEAGTYRLTDLCPGRCGGLGPIFGFLGERLLFGGFDGGGPDLWSTDGTIGGETPVADFCPGPCQPFLRSWAVWQGHLWLLTGTEGSSPMIWTTDGTASGTFRLGNACRDFALCAPPSDSPYGYSFELAPGDRGLLLVAASFRTTCLYRTDGTAAGSVQLHCSPTARTGRALPGRSLPTTRTTPAADEPYYFFIDGPELWRTDGTPEGTSRVRNLEDLLGEASPRVAGLRTLNGICHLLVEGRWVRSDGTPEGTLVLARDAFWGSGRFAQLGSRILLIGSQGIWATEGTPATTRRVIDVFGGAERIVETPTRLFVEGFLSDYFLWTTDGTSEGTETIRLPEEPKLDTYSLDIAALDGRLLFSRGLQELWTIDSTGTDARPLKAFRGRESWSWLDQQIVLGDRLIFFAMDQSGEAQGSFGPYGTARLYASNGSPEGTRLLSRVTTPIGDVSTASSAPGPDFFKVGNRVYFNSGGLSVTDGTAAGTGVAHQRPALRQSRAIDAIGDRLLFSGTTSQVFCADESELWITTGERDSTRRLADLNPQVAFGGSRCEDQPRSSDPGPGVSLGSRIVFAAEDGIHGRELFVTDGTKPGSRMLLDIRPGPPAFSGSAPGDFVRLGGKALFVADDGVTGRELWATNGTLAGTYRVADLRPGPLGSSPRNLVVAGKWVYFFATTGRRESLWRSDGTALGTSLVSDLARNGTPAIAGSELVVAGAQLFFPAYSGDAGLELWRSGGTADTTGLVEDLWPGPRSATPQRLAAVRNGVVFAASDGQTGLESWWSDGSRTVFLGDIAAGLEPSSPGPFSVVGQHILTGADDGEIGRELWSIPLADIPQP